MQLKVNTPYRITVWFTNCTQKAYKRSEQQGQEAKQKNHA